jgi:hypothetical protein
MMKNQRQKMGMHCLWNSFWENKTNAN